MRYVITLLMFAFAAWAADSKDVIFIDNQKVSANFAKGGTLLSKEAYDILTSRRVGPGEVEVHAQMTDVIYVTEGSATIVTGGTVIEGRTTAAGEIRGKSTQGGVSQKLSKGDVLVVPNGVPHWFQQVDKLITYYVVKIRAAQ